MMLMILQAASVLGCERLWLNISATLFFLSFHAGSDLTIGVASWTWSTFAVALDLKRKLATKSCIASFLDPNLDPKTGRYKISPPLKFTAPASTFRPCSTCVSCSGFFSPPRASSSSSYYYYYYYYCQMAQELKAGVQTLSSQQGYCPLPLTSTIP